MSPHPSERGSALLITMVVLIVILGVSVAFVSVTASQSKQQFVDQQDDRSYNICNAALEKTRRALFKYRIDDSWAWNDILLYCQSVPTDPEAVKKDYFSRIHGEASGTAGGAGTKDTGRSSGIFTTYASTADQPGANTSYEAPLPASKTAPTAKDNDYYRVFLGWNYPYAEGAHHVVIRDNDDGDSDLLADVDGQVLAIITGTLPDGTQRQIETLLKLESANAPPGAAVEGNGNGMISGGNPIIDGVNGSVHLNGDLTISGNPTLTHNLTAGGTLFIGGSPTVGGTQAGGQPTHKIPVIDPKTLKSTATYIYKADGRVFNQAGVLVYSAGGEFQGWKFTGSSGWDFGADTPPASSVTCYFEAPAVFNKDYMAKIGGNPGSLGSPMKMTIIAECSIMISGNPSLAPDSGRSDEVTLYSGGDIGISGNPMNGYVGYYAAHEQLKVNGNPIVNGSMVAENADTRYEHVKGYSIDISGDPHITFKAVKVPNSAPTKVTLVSYRRLK